MTTTPGSFQLDVFDLQKPCGQAMDEAGSSKSLMDRPSVVYALINAMERFGVMGLDQTCPNSHRNLM